MVEINGNLVAIKEDTRYWIVRAGVNANYFTDFQVDSRIAIGYDRFDDLKSIQSVEYDFFREQIVSKYPEIGDIESKRSRSKRISDIATKIHRFVNELKIGDIVVTPGKDNILIGEIISDAIISNTHYDSDYQTTNIKDKNIIGSLNKIREVKWVKNIPRDEAEPNLKLILGVIHGIASINDQQVITEINRTLYDFYSVGSVGHSIFNITSQDNINFKKYANFIKTIDDINSLYYPKEDLSKLAIKTNIQSPGPIELIGDIPIIQNLILGAKAVLKKDKSALAKLPPELQAKTQEYIKDNQVQFDYDDYEFPNHTSS